MWTWLAAPLLVVAAVLSWFMIFDPDLPLMASTRSRCAYTVDRLRPGATPATIMSFDVAGIRLGMSADEAVRRLRDVSRAVRVRPGPRLQPERSDPHAVRGKASWANLANGFNIDRTSLGTLGGLTRAPDRIEIGSSIWPDGQERVTSITYVAQSTMGLSSANNADMHPAVRSALSRRLGPPTVDGHDCLGNRFVTYGNDPNISNPSAVLTYTICSAFGEMTGNESYVCDRRRAVRSPFIHEYSHHDSFVLRIQDGQSAYATRYTNDYDKSRLAFQEVHPN